MATLDVLVFYVPVADTESVMEALFQVGAGRIGDYDRSAFVMQGRGQFRPLAGADPTIGRVGELEYVTENRVEMTFRTSLREIVVRTLREAHPYEEPAFHVLKNFASD